jgi:hypothetical protein
MGHSILINDKIASSIPNNGGTGFAFSTLTFEVITEGTRSQFKIADQGCMKACFEDLDDRGQDYICLYDIDEKCFNVFRVACELGLQKLKETRDVTIDYAASPAQISNFIENWEDVITALQHDPRCKISISSL